MNAIEITITDLTDTLAKAAQSPRKRVIDEATGEVVGWIVYHGTYVEWGSGDFGGTVPSRDDALARIEETELNRRRGAANEEARRAEIDATPEPLKSLRIERDQAALELEIERHRNVIRSDDLVRAYDRLQAAERACAAAEHEAREAA